ncbi:hypothetical protein E1B28_006360 [Marasmius oreades]|uniref:DUF6534 domain-containing protein n=1 Tax=Marasmius oreades TaxID=181124 RepID=A0A9P7S5D1_9AGAR|nr:uncharacterized protein E1B28_006360 [Marasmius oreades]KAG7095637.1 hypothetical protein E1B28_006360 [Marasmius oreades]
MGAGNLSDGSSEQEFNALINLPLFLGYIISFFLQGILLVQVFAYYLSFRKDSVIIKAAVWFVFILEWASTIIATVAALISFVKFGQLSDLSSFTLFKALAPLCGLVTLVVQSFYCYRIYALSRRLVIPGIILLLSLTQCAMVIVAGFESELGVGLESAEDPFISTVCVVWLTSTPIADFLIALTLIILLSRASRMIPSEKTRLEKIMMVSVETGLITGCAALTELIFFLAFRNSMLHFILFYILPKLYSNSMMATLNARLAIPGRTFRESGQWEWAKGGLGTEVLSPPIFAERSLPQVDEKQKSVSERPSVETIVSDCTSTVDAFWSTYTPIAKYSPAFLINRTASHRIDGSVGRVTLFDSEDPHFARERVVST